jgi:DNA-binding NtrC family response regulator
MLESELFGHERGAFTGAVTRKIGKFELSHRGTLFLDEISELYPELQVKLLRVLEERQVMRVGGSELIPVDFRLVAATNRDLEKEVAGGRFREDLYYRLKVVTLRIPPLRERPGDIPQLAEHFLTLFCQEHGKPPKRLGVGALEILSRYPWPGNVRQLRNVIESAVVFSQGDEITPADLPIEVRESSSVSAAGASAQITVGAAGAAGGPRTMADIERQAILETLESTGGHRAKAADLLGIGLRTLQRKLKEYKDEGYIQED